MTAAKTSAVTLDEFLRAATIHQRMCAILGALPPIGKDQKNQQQGFMFRGHDDVLNALNPLLARYGVFVMPNVLDRIPAQRTTAKGSVLFEVNLHVEFTFFGALGDSITASAWGEGTDSGDKSTNKAMTMAFKNVLNQAFAISNKEVSDADADTPPETVSRASAPAAAETKKTGPPEPTAEQLTELYRLVEERGGDADTTRAGAETAEQQGKLGVWYLKAFTHWSSRKVATEFEKKGADAIKAGVAAQGARAAQAQADRGEKAA